MDTYPRLAEGLDFAWTPDRSRIVAYNTSSGNVVATLTVKEGLFLSQLDGDVDPDDVGDFTQRERFRVLAKFASRGLLENDEKFEVSTKGLGTVTLSIPTPALSKTKSSVGLCLYYLAVRYLWVPLAVVCGIIAVFDLNDRYYGDYVPSAFDMIVIIGIALVLHELSHIAAAHYCWIPTSAVGIGLYHFLPCAFIKCELMAYAPQSIRRKISIAGPTANVALSGICFILYVLIGHDVLFWVSMESLILGMVNFLPFPGLDGNKFLSSFASKGESVLSISNIDFIAVGGCVAAGFATYVCAKMMPLWLAFVTTEVVMLVVAMAVSSNVIANFFLWGWICALPIGHNMADLFCTIDYKSPLRRICVIILTALIAAAFSNLSVAVVNYFVEDM